MRLLGQTSQGGQEVAVIEPALLHITWLDFRGEEAWLTLLYNLFRSFPFNLSASLFHLYIFKIRVCPFLTCTFVYSLHLLSVEWTLYYFFEDKIVASVLFFTYCTKIIRLGYKLRGLVRYLT